MNSECKCGGDKHHIQYEAHRSAWRKVIDNVPGFSGDAVTHLQRRVGSQDAHNEGCAPQQDL
jgi:hypothetical protein